MMGFQAFKRAVPISSGFLEKMGGEEGSWSGFVRTAGGGVRENLEREGISLL